MSATVPATCGEAMDVPLIDAYFEFVGTLLPNVDSRSGDVRLQPAPPPKAEGPRLEKLAIALLTSKAPAL